MGLTFVYTTIYTRLPLLRLPHTRTLRYVPDCTHTRLHVWTFTFVLITIERSVDRLPVTRHTDAHVALDYTLHTRAPGGRRWIGCRSTDVAARGGYTLVHPHAFVRAVYAFTTRAHGLPHGSTRYHTVGSRTFRFD